jgi:hypothetical protein
MVKLGISLGGNDGEESQCKPAGGSDVRLSREVTDNHSSERITDKGIAVRCNTGDFSLDLKFTERGVKTGVQGK